MSVFFTLTKSAKKQTQATDINRFYYNFTKKTTGQTLENNK